MFLSPQDPILFSLGPITVYWYGLIVTSALVLGLILSEKIVLGRKLLTSDQFGLISIAMVLSALVGARLYHVFVLNFPYYISHLNEVVRIWDGGIAIHGAIIGGLLSFCGLFFYYKYDYLSLLDIFAPALLLGQSIGRWGNYFNQEAFGRETGVWWGIFIDRLGTSHHPTFFYESVLNLLFAVVLYYFLLVKKSTKGLVFASYLGIYGLIRLVIEPFRLDSTYIGEIAIASIVSMVFIVSSLIILGLLNYNRS